MSLYLDASILVALLTHDPFTPVAGAWFRTHRPVPVLSDFAAALARRVRTRDLTKAEARSAFATPDAWAASATQRAETTGTDIAAAGAFLRRLDLTLRTPDALNIAIAQRLRAEMATFDMKMATAARRIGLATPSLAPA